MITHKNKLPIVRRTIYLLNVCYYLTYVKSSLQANVFFCYELVRLIFITKIKMAIQKE
jgi:hypothetical protein